MAEITLTLSAHAEYSYVPRTRFNAESASLTVAFATDFTTAGERLTKNAAGERYVAIQLFSSVDQAVTDLVAALRKHGNSMLNVAGNSLATLREHSQKDVNDWIYAVLKGAHAQIGIQAVRSGGQTGADHGGLVAAIALGISATGLYPKSFRQRNAQGDEIHSTSAQLVTLIKSEAAAYRPTRKFHKEGSVPENGEIFVFGSNLAGRHGLGSAAVAQKSYGAIRFQGKGRQGSSYAVPTKDGRNNQDLKLYEATLSIPEITGYIEEFMDYARAHPDLQFFVVRLGCSLARHHDSDIAPLFRNAPSNCSFSEAWKPWLSHEVTTKAPINIFSGSSGLGGALTNMSEMAKSKGCIKHSYPVTINDVTYPDSEAAYQGLKIPGNDEYNDGLMIDIISLKFTQHPKLVAHVEDAGGADWLAKCSHFTGAKSERFQAWEGQGMGSRFIRNLVWGFKKFKTGRGPTTRAVHVEHAPYDVYGGRDMTAKNPKYQPVGLGNPYPIIKVGSLEKSLLRYYKEATTDPTLNAQIKALKGRTIGCWCKTRKDYNTQCHVDIIVAIAEGRQWELKRAAQASLF